MNSNPRIKVRQLRPIEKGSLLGIVAIEIDGLLISDCRLIKDGDKAPWLSPPQRAWTAHSGESRWTTIVRWPSSYQKQIDAAAWAVWQEYQQEREGGPQ